jgi:hypothetical protein
MRAEDALQKAVATLLDHSGLVWQHSPNEGKRTPRAGAHAKSLGMKAGFPDIAIYSPICSTMLQSWNGLAIELKAGKNRPTPSQLEWRDKLIACGWRWKCCYSVDEVLALLRECYPGKFLP